MNSFADVGFSFPLQLKRSPRAKRVRLTVKTVGVECVMPLACSEDQAFAFIRQHQEWLVAKYWEAVARVPARTFWDELANNRESMLPVQGRDVPLRVTGGAGTRSRLNVSTEVFLLRLPDQQRQHWNALSERALFKWAQCWLAERADEIMRHHYGRVLLQARHVRIKRMRTRWGSCGAHNDINLNWLLTFAPPLVLEYVVVHELCHVRHRDHSVRFWSLVGEHLPTYADQRAWLKNHGRGLMNRFGEAGR